MRLGNPLSLFTILLIALILSGCQGSPLIPDTVTSPGSTRQSSVSSDSNHQLLGFYTLVVDTEDFTVGVLQARSGNFHINVVNALNASMGVSVMGIPAEHDPPNGLFVFDVTLTHPFATKPQLTGFDVKGILMTPGSLSISPLIFADVDECRLENADGYTRWWNPTEFYLSGMFGYTEGILAPGPTVALNATVNPYKVFADILAAESPLTPVSDEPLDNPMGRSVFTSGSSNVRRYRIRFAMDPGPQIIFGYAVDASWDFPIPNPPVEIPDDFPIEANQPEACRIVVNDSVNTLFYDSESGLGGGVLRLLVNVHDWQGQLAGNIPDEVSAVEFFAPGLMTGAVDAGFVTVITNKARYSADLTGLAVPTEAGDSLIVCRVGSSDNALYKQSGAPAPDEFLSAYQVLPIQIPDPECVTDSNNNFGEAVALPAGGSAIDQVCSPEDVYDYFTFEIPLGYRASGEIRLYTGAQGIHLGVFDQNETVLDGITSGTGQITLDLEPIDMMPGTYYIAVMHGGGSAVLPYYLELDEQFVDVTPSNPIEVTPSTLYVNPDFVWMHDDYAYLLGKGMWVYDISNPTLPVQVACYLDVYALDSASFSYPYCYFIQWVSPEKVISVIDFTNPAAPVITEDVVQITDDLAAVTMNSTHLYVGTSVNPTSEVKIFNYITDPLNPSEIGSVSVPYEPQILGLINPEFAGTHLVVGTWGDILTFNVENVLAITPAGSYSFPSGAPRDIATFGNYIYVGHDSTGGGNGWLYIFRQSLVPDLEDLGFCDLPGTASHVAVAWPYVYVGDGDSGLTIVDIPTPMTPYVVGSTPLYSRGMDLDVQDDLVCIIPMEDGLHLLDVSIPASPVTVSRLRVVNDPWAMQMKNDCMIVGNSGMWSRSIKTIDLYDPLHATVIGDHYMTDPPGRLSLDGDILASGIGTDWRLFDATDPVNLIPGGFGTTPSILYDIGVCDNTLYVSYQTTIDIYDVSNFAAPSYENSLILIDQCRGLSFAEGYMYLRLPGFIPIYSIADPLNPTPVEAYLLSDVRDMAIQGDYLHMITEDAVEIADISDPTTPTFTGSTTLPVSDWLERIIVDGQFAYVTTMANTPYASWIWPPDAPSAYGPVHTNDHYKGGNLLTHNGYLYQATEQAGIRIFDLY